MFFKPYFLRLFAISSYGERYEVSVAHYTRHHFLSGRQHERCGSGEIL